MNDSKYMNLLYCTIFALFIFMLSGCSDFLDTESRNTLTELNQWENEKNADIYLNGIYSTLDKPNTPDPLDSYTDDNDGGPYWASWQWKQGIATPEVRGGYPMVQDDVAHGFMKWSNVYERIRKCNEFLFEIEAHKMNYSEEWINQRIDEVRFLRAFFTPVYGSMLEEWFY